jgi:hypothetical protein
VFPSHDRRENIAAARDCARGMAMHNNLAFVSPSKIRETFIFCNVPNAELRCGIG